MNKVTIAVLTVLLIFSAFSFVTAEPNGANHTEESNERAGASQAESHNASAGNITELTVIGISITQSWQGYFGNVSGAIELADADDNVMYNWSLASPSGEVYATMNDSVNWTSTACATNATDTPILEAYFGIAGADVDGVDETFFASNDHDEFYVNNIQIAAGTCELSARIFGDTGAGVDTEFEEVILKAGSGEYVFASILDKDLEGFDSATHDFEMLVLEDGHDSDTDTTTYYFYVELE